jgi:hypothetical protein
MGVTALIPDMTFKQLYDEAQNRWGEIWDPNASRLQIMLLLPRKQRKLLELHGDMIDHGQPVMAIFNRPRAQIDLLEKQGFDHRKASFQFVDLASADLGPWMQHLVTQEGWLRNTIEIAPVPFSMDVPNQRAFEKHSILCFRHPDLPSLDTYHLPYPVTAVNGKAFVSLPRRQAAELARQQAEILGVGLAKPEPEVVAVPIIESKPIIEPTMKMEEDFVSSMVPEMPVPLPNQPEIIEKAESIPLPEAAPEVDDAPPIEKEFKAIVQELLDEGVDPSDMMSDERLADVQERALAVGFETWPVFMQMVA